MATAHADVDLTCEAEAAGSAEARTPSAGSQPHALASSFDFNAAETVELDPGVIELRNTIETLQKAQHAVGLGTSELRAKKAKNGGTLWKSTLPPEKRPGAKHKLNARNGEVDALDQKLKDFVETTRLPTSFRRPKQKPVATQATHRIMYDSTLRQNRAVAIPEDKNPFRHVGRDLHPWPEKHKLHKVSTVVKSKTAFVDRPHKPDSRIATKGPWVQRVKVRPETMAPWE